MLKKLSFHISMFAGILFNPNTNWAAENSIETTQRVLNKNNRTMDNPPKNLRASPATSKSYFASGRSTASTTEETTGDAEVTTKKVEAREDVEKYSNPWSSLRSQKRNQGLRRFAFSGERIVGVGLVGAGTYGIFGAEFDFKVTDDWSSGFGLGTGMSYSTWSLHARKYLHRGENLNTFLRLGYANWYLGEKPSNNEDVKPYFLARRFLADKKGNMIEGKRANLIYPSIGVDYQHESGLAFATMLQYLVSAKDFSGALYGSFSCFYYF